MTIHSNITAKLGDAEAFKALRPNVLALAGADENLLHQASANLPHADPSISFQAQLRRDERIIAARYRALRDAAKAVQS